LRENSTILRKNGSFVDASDVASKIKLSLSTEVKTVLLQIFFDLMCFALTTDPNATLHITSRKMKSSI
jgi:hypothetical protein